LQASNAISGAKGGWAGIMSRQIWPDAPAYSCLPWLWTKAMGTSEIMLRISSMLPMLAAVYLLYLAARELFDRDVALIAAIAFCLHPIIIFAAIGRPQLCTCAHASFLLAALWTRRFEKPIAVTLGLAALPEPGGCVAILLVGEAQMRGFIPCCLVEVLPL
jgi:hypothetical protein